MGEWGSERLGLFTHHTISFNLYLFLWLHLLIPLFLTTLFLYIYALSFLSVFSRDISTGSY